MCVWKESRPSSRHQECMRIKGSHGVGGDRVRGRDKDRDGDRGATRRDATKIRRSELRTFKNA